MKTLINDLEDRLSFLRNVTKVQNESISVCYDQVTALVNSNALISRDIDSLYAEIRTITKEENK